MKRRNKANYVVIEENGVFIARCDDLDLEARGASEKEAVASLEEALALFFEDLPGPADG
jgi:predicted RNase H-like HicB family nuclease